MPIRLCQLDAEVAAKSTNHTTFPVNGWAEIATPDASTFESKGLTALPVATTAELVAELIAGRDNGNELAGSWPVKDPGRTQSVSSDESDQIDEV